LERQRLTLTHSSSPATVDVPPRRRIEQHLAPQYGTPRSGRPPKVQGQMGVLTPRTLVEQWCTESWEAPWLRSPRRSLESAEAGGPGVQESNRVSLLLRVESGLGLKWTKVGDRGFSFLLGKREERAATSRLVQVVADAVESESASARAWGATTVGGTSKS
jgi:hypothetical protein